MYLQGGERMRVHGTVVPVVFLYYTVVLAKKGLVIGTVTSESILEMTLA